LISLVGCTRCIGPFFEVVAWLNIHRRDLHTVTVASLSWCAQGSSCKSVSLLLMACLTGSSVSSLAHHWWLTSARILLREQMSDWWLTSIQALRDSALGSNSST
jgi:hypothetical protein